MKIVDTAEYISTLRELTEQGMEVSLKISGSSMMPFLAGNRDIIYFSRPSTPLKVGDMVFYQRPGGQFVVHRICAIRDEKLYLAGDAQQILEGPVDPERVFARITQVCRKGKMLRPGSFCWEFFAHGWILLRPIRQKILAGYSLLANIRRRLLLPWFRRKNVENTGKKE